MPDKLTDTGILRRIAPTLAELPRWTRKLRPAVAWTGICLVFTGAGTLFVRAVALDKAVALANQRAELEHKDIQRLEVGLADLKEVRKAQAEQGKILAVVSDNTGKLMYAHEEQVWVLQADWNKRHHLPIPPPPPPPEGAH
jgi:hypothetical protein